MPISPLVTFIEFQGHPRFHCGCILALPFSCGKLHHFPFNLPHTNCSSAPAPPRSNAMANSLSPVSLYLFILLREVYTKHAKVWYLTK